MGEKIRFGSHDFFNDLESRFGEDRAESIVCCIYYALKSVGEEDYFKKESVKIDHAEGSFRGVELEVFTITLQIRYCINYSVINLFYPDNKYVLSTMTPEEKGSGGILLKCYKGGFK